MQLDYNVQKDIKQNKDKKQEFINAKTLGLNYNWQQIGDEYRKEIIEDAKTSSKKLTSLELNQMIEQKLKSLRPRDFCLRQVLKMCFYLQKLHEKEVLQVNCDFFQDDNGEIWLFHATDILVRPRVKSQVEAREEDEILIQQRIKREKREEMQRL